MKLLQIIKVIKLQVPVTYCSTSLRKLGQETELSPVS